MLEFWDILATVLELTSSTATLLLALMAYLSVREVRRDRRLRYLERRIEDFYKPLIELFSHGTLLRGSEEHRRVEEIIVARRYLCGEKLARILPQHFTAVVGDAEYYFRFTSERELDKWVKVADTMWEEFIDVLREYYELIGVKEYRLPEKPSRWMFRVEGR